MKSIAVFGLDPMQCYVYLRPLISVSLDLPNASYDQAFCVALTMPDFFDLTV